MTVGGGIPRWLLWGLTLGVLVLPSLAAAAEGAPSTPSDRFLVGLQPVPDDVRPGHVWHGGRVIAVHAGAGLAIVKAQRGSGFEAEARADARVRYVAPDEAVAALDVLPNDPLYADQYGLPQVRAPLAWDTTLGDESANACIVDTGVRYTHEDLAGDRWKGGYDFVNDDADPWDDHGHGTHVAGIAAATLNNALGIAGLAQVGLYAVKVLNSFGSGSWADVAGGILWCADHTPDRTVINLSLGACTANPGTQDAIRYAYNTRGKLLVAAAGNLGNCQDQVNYPARFDEVVAVTCTRQGEGLCGFSVQGPKAEISAPGDRILSTWATSDAAYATGNGTSMSAPHVAAAAALVWGQRPALTNVQVRHRLDATAQDLGALDRDAGFGWGEVDAACALTCAIPLPGPPGNLQVSNDPGAERASLAWEQPGDKWSDFVTNYRVYRGTSSDGPFAALATLGPAFGYEDSGLAPYRVYHYRVSAISGEGEGPASAAACTDHNPAKDALPPGLRPCVGVPGDA